jgi:hypothetical protein
MFLITIVEKNGEFEYTHHMLVPTLEGTSNKELISQFYGDDDVDEEFQVGGYYWVWGELLARVKSTQTLTDDEAVTLIKFL